MTRMSRTERTELCDAALQVGEDAPTLCEGWTVKDLVVHLLLRERSPAAVGIAVPQLAGLTDRESRRLGREDFAVLVERLRTGPPRWSPYAVPKLEPVLNTLEYFVHHEDIRRARPAWAPRELPAGQQNLLWSMIATTGKGLTRKAGVGVLLERSDTGDRTRVHAGEPDVVVRGLPSEITLYLFGRQAQARVELAGPDDAVAKLSDAGLGF